MDDSIEVREVLGANSGRDPLTTFMKKSRLPKKPTSLSGMSNTTSSCFRLTACITELNSADHYTDMDLGIGKVISVFGRPFLLYLER